MAVEVFREPLYRRYFAPLNSYAFLHNVFMLFLVIFLPLIIAYNTDNFWLKEATVYEQPSIKYRYEVIFELRGNSRDNGFQSYFWSSSSTLNQLHASNLIMPILKSAEADDDLDGKIDRIEVNALFPLMGGATVQSVQALLLHDVQLQGKAKYQFDAATLYSYETAVPMAQLYVDGDARFRQTWPLKVKGGYRDPYNGDKLLNLDDEFISADSASISNIMRKSLSRNFSVVADTNVAYSEPTVVARDGFPSGQSFFNATFTLRIPKIPIRYTPSVSEVVKFAWIQYAAFFVVVAFLLYRLNAFIFRHQLVYAHGVSDIVIGKTL